MPRLKELLKLDSLLGRTDRSLALCLAAAALCAWFLVNCLQAQMTFLIDDYSLRTSLPQWHPTWPLVPWLLTVVGVVLAYVRMRFFGLDLRRRLLQLSVLTFCLIALRLGVLWTPLGILMPYLAILWAPHLTWVLGLLFLLYLHAPIETGKLSPPQTYLIAGLLFIGSALLYGSYTLYFCQTTMLHGDEAHYLQLTQSLIHEGDMDLSDNIAFAKVREFHIVEFGVHKALTSPPDKIYSVHPIGLSVLLVPAYWLGLQWWENPRLGCALFMALLTAACIALAFIWLVRLRMAPLTAALSTAITGLAVPVFIYNNQIYPEIPALFINLLVLAALAHWQRPAGGYRSLGRGEWALLGLLTLLLAGLPFLHPRLLPLAGLGGLLVLLQAWHSPQRPFALAAVSTATLAGLTSLVTFNFAFSGDWMGHFHPGNAWGEGVLRFGTLATSLPGQWLQRDMGLGNSSPVFLFALPGLVFLLHKSSHSLRLLIISFYFATLVVNGLNGADWVMGHCYPARFFVVAVPLLLLGLAAFLDTSYSRPVLLFFFLCALSVTLDTVIEISKVPERGFIGYVLPVRAINYFYPWDVHFYPEKDRAWPLGDLTFWGALLAGAFSLVYYREKMPLLARAGLPLLLALLPYLWGKSTVFQGRVQEYFQTLTVTTAIADVARPDHHFTPHFPLPRSSIQTTGDYLPDGTFLAQENKHSPGLLSSHPISILKPGKLSLS